MDKEDGISAPKTSIQSLDINKLLKLLNTTDETEIQVKVFTILAAYLVSNRDEKEMIVKYHNIYEKVNSVLIRCLPLKTAGTLDFVTALVISEEDVESLTRRHSLAMYAKNRVRVSGCLSTMATLFSSCMMYQDTWKSLCRALAETCNSSELNQSYCSHLVPLCVQKCSRGSVDVYLVLQSLLRNHERNIQLFLESEGVTLFTREQLENDLCMQLLVILVQSSRKATLVIKESKIFDCLRKLIQTYGKHSKMGQWAKIVLYYIESHTKGTQGHARIEAYANDAEQKSKSFYQIKNKDDKKNSFKCELEKEQDTDELFQNIVKELFHSKANLGYLQTAISNIRTQAMNLSNEQNMHAQNSIHTANMPYKQSARGIDLKINYQEQNLKQKCNTRKTNEARIQKPKINTNSFAKYYRDSATKKNESKISDNSKKTLSFSFLLQDSNYSRRIHQTSTYHANKYNPKTNITKNLALLNANKSDQRITNNDNDTQAMIDSIDLYDFRPISVSTPKSRKEGTTEIQTTCSKYNSASQFSMNQYKHASKISRRVRKQKHRVKPTKVKQLTRKSISSRFFNAINGSCTTLVKTVKNIFTTRRDKSTHEELTNSHSSNSSVKTCSYSFTNYMRKRDAVLVNDNSEIQGSSMMRDACKTCNDTVVLQRKLKDDDHLKKTIKKLKLGINLYGCDFKKISRNFWPRETYMTPAVLYNLYRKLIVK